MPALIIQESEENIMEKVVNKNQNQHWLGADTAGYDDFRIKQMMPLPIGTTVMAVDVDEDDNVVMRDCDEISQPYCLVLTEDERGKTDIYPYNLSTDGGIDVRGTVIPNRHCPKCHKKMQPHMTSSRRTLHLVWTRAVLVTRASCTATPPMKRQSRYRSLTWSPPSSCNC